MIDAPPPSPAPADLPPATAPRPAPAPPSTLLTALCAVFVLASLFEQGHQSTLEARIQAMNDPADAVAEIGENAWALDVAVQSAAPFERLILWLAGEIRADFRADQLAAFDAVIRTLESEPDDAWALFDQAALARAHRAAFLAENGHIDAARGDWEHIAQSRQGLRFAKAMAYIYDGTGRPNPRWVQAAVEDTLGPGWTFERVRRSLALRLGDRAGAAQIEQNLAAAAAQARRERWSVAVTYVATWTAGLILFWAWLSGCLGSGRAGRGPPPPWTALWGLAAILRYEVVSWTLAKGFVQSGVDLLMNLATYSSALLTAVPLAWMSWRYLRLPWGVPRRDLFGLRVPWRTVPWLLAVGLGAYGMDQFATFIITLIKQMSGTDAAWIESIDETLWEDTSFWTVLYWLDLTVFAPVLEEIYFRGILYGTLRLRWGPAPAALASSLLFAGVHFYSWEGALQLFVGSLFWTITYEKTGSLWPAIFAHSLRNGYFSLLQLWPPA